MISTKNWSAMHHHRWGTDALENVMNAIDSEPPTPGKCTNQTHQLLHTVSARVEPFPQSHLLKTSKNL